MRRFLCFTFLIIVISSFSVVGGTSQLKINTQSEQLNQFVSRGISFFKIEKYEQAVIEFQQAIALAKAFNYREASGYLFFYLGQTFHALHQFEKARNAYVNALKYLPDTQPRILTFTRMADIFFQQNVYKTALGYYTSALNLSRQLADTSHQIILLGKIADSYFQVGELSRAYLSYHRGLELATLRHNQIYETKFLSDVGYMYYYFGDYSNALIYYNLALKAVERIDQPDLIGKIHTDLGDLYQTVGDTSQAKSHFAAALHIYQKNQNYAGEIKILIHSGELFLKAGSHQKAFKLFRLARMLQQRYHYWHESGRIELGIAMCHFQAGNLRNAIHFLNQAKKSVTKFSQHSLLWKIHVGYAQIYEQQQKYLKAAREYESAIRIVENLRAKISFETYRTGYFEKMLPLYENYVKLLLSPDLTDSIRVHAAFHFMERFRARSFLESLSTSQIKQNLASQKLDSLLVQKRIIEQEFFQNLAEIENLAFLNKSEADSLRPELFKKRTQYETWLRGIEFEIEREYEKVELPEEIDVVLTLEELQEALIFDDIVILEYFLSDPNSFVWVISKNHFSVYQIPARQLILEQIKILLGSISFPEQRFTDLFEKPGRRLFEMLLQPIQSRIDSAQKLVIIPDGELAYLPFELLRLSGGNSNHRYLIETHQVLYAPSTSIFFRSTRNDRTPDVDQKELLIVGNPSLQPADSTEMVQLHVNWQNEVVHNELFQPWQRVKPLYFVQQEITRISQLFLSNQVTVLSGEKATESHFKQFSNPARYKRIHFATHGFINESESQLSGLFLGLPDSLEDGFLRIPEISQLRLNADLVVLSACQTGRGKLYRSNEVESLARAFMAAGTSAVIVSLWNVDDRSTAIFMEDFYRYLKEDNQSPSGALARTKIDMLKSEEFQHPYYWAPFVLISCYENTADFLILGK